VKKDREFGHGIGNPRTGVILLACVLGSVAVGRSEPVQPPQQLRVISYNVQFLPGLGKLFNARGNDDYRPRRLGEVLREFDIIGLNEVFERGPRKQLLAEIQKEWGDAFHVYECPEPAASVGRYNAGLAIVSRFPIRATHHIPYSAASTKKEFGVFADEFAAKGALHARIEIPRANGSFEVDVFTTHLDSKLASARAIQGTELARFAAEHAGPGNLALLLGDFNTRGPARAEDPPPRAEYPALLDRLRTFRPSVQDAWLLAGQGPPGTSEQLEEQGGTRIDYVFLALPTEGTSPLSLRSVRVERFLDPKVTSLSDHSAVVAEFDLRD
jgi:endonuclease/exonuclease/phosphatase family metal-dependent hydrolase